ncbi:dihydroorotase [Candidatus Woesearchaeota archaeon]|nr:MAG: dihydroorotase [Candidatus Woesearchaeota archaeon]
MSLLLKNCRILKDGKVISTNILVDDDKIKKVGFVNEADKIFNVNNNFVLPGLIDPHVHFREPGMTHKEDFYTGSRAAAAGGITGFLDMPNTRPPTLTLSDLEEKKELARKSVVNYGFHFGTSKDNLEEIRKARNIAGVKVFMNQSTGKMMINDDNALHNIFSNSRIVLTHAEDEMVGKALEITKQSGNMLYLCHISQESELESIRKSGLKVFAEATPHHLFLTEKKVDELKGFAMMKPPLRKESDRIALWNALKDGTITTVGSDHAPHTIEEKESEEPPFGVPGIETMLPLMLNEVNKQNITLQTVQELMCENPCRIFNIANQGRIDNWYSANLTIINMKKEKRIRNDELFTKVKWSPFNGLKLKGWPVMTIVNGQIVFENGQIIEEKAGRPINFNQ